MRPDQPHFQPWLRPLSIVDLERMTPAQLQRREAFEQQQEKDRLDWEAQQRRQAAPPDATRIRK